ncbi:MAG TPA: hypothetical protein VN793_00530 [Acidimicrobiales bacterium]|nr:hypothetical protein [Acidimicrobiales bacterium]
MIFARTADVSSFTYDVNEFGQPWANNPAAHWNRGQIVRLGQPAEFNLPPRKIMFDPTDPTTFWVKGSGYRPN